MNGTDAVAIGLADQLVPQNEVREARRHWQPRSHYPAPWRFRVFARPYVLVWLMQSFRQLSTNWRSRVAYAKPLIFVKALKLCPSVDHQNLLESDTDFQRLKQQNWSAQALALNLYARWLDRRMTRSSFDKA
ncbi:MAG: hypothetical protein CM1200mP18_03100 [Gammaproteobacteria bacterium]|nr:MAG: hypothetical protein CM1200mP18_03100 [Gammaproteobacteria bacterium]